MNIRGNLIAYLKRWMRFLLRQSSADVAQLELRTAVYFKLCGFCEWKFQPIDHKMKYEKEKA